MRICIPSCQFKISEKPGSFFYLFLIFFGDERICSIYFVSSRLEAASYIEN